jgi:hypothetical protein
MKATVKQSTARRGITRTILSVTLAMVLTLSLWITLTPVSAAPLCGNGSAPDYGFSYEMQQAHWTVNWQDYVSEQTITDVDVILDQLNADSIAQTMILILPQEQVGNRVNCAVHFLRYMRLGLPTGERKDNGFVFLIVVEPDRIDVHYGVGLGLPALTASELTTLNRAAEAEYKSSGSLDQALLTLAQGFDDVTRNNYAPLVYPTPSPAQTAESRLPAGSQGLLVLCGQVCIGMLLLLFLLWGASVGRRGGFGSSGSGSGLGGLGGFPLGGSGRIGGGSRSSPPMRGGSGSGRSGRGN